MKNPITQNTEIGIDIVPTGASKSMIGLGIGILLIVGAYTILSPKPKGR